MQGECARLSVSQPKTAHASWYDSLNAVWGLRKAGSALSLLCNMFAEVIIVIQTCSVDISVDLGMKAVSETLT